METNKNNINTILTKKEANINNPNLYFYLSLINLTYYINFFPKLDNEKVQRLKYYFNLLYKELQEVNLSLIDVQTPDKDILNYTLLKLFFNKPNDSSFITRSLICEIIVLESYTEIANLISRKNIFTRSIEYKISKIISSIKKTFIKKITKIKQRKILTFQDLYNLSEEVLKNKFYMNLEKRQNIRFGYINFQEYKNKVKDFQFFPDRNNVIFRYNRNKINNCSDYEKRFFQDLPKILDDIEHITMTKKETQTKQKPNKKL